MSASVKVLLIKSKKRKDGTIPLAIRFIVDRKPRYLYLGHTIFEKDWDPKNGGKVKGSHVNQEMLNALISKKKAEAEKELITIEMDEKQISSLQLKQRVSKKHKRTSFFTVAEDYLNDLEKTHKYNRLSGERPRIKYFKEFITNEIDSSGDVALHQVNESLLKKFRVYLSHKRNISERTITNYLIVIRTIYNRAITEGFVDQRYYPFGKGKVRIKTPESAKIGLTESELKFIQSLELQHYSPIWNARNIWLTSFYLAGARISDVMRIKWSDIIDERLHYMMGKNLKTVTLKIPEKILTIFSHYLQQKRFPTDYIFNELKKSKENDQEDEYRKIRTANTKINRYMSKIAKMCEIEKPISAHIARHTFGNISGDKISPQMLQKLYRHSDLKTTIGYQANFIHKNADEALDSVINF